MCVAAILTNVSTRNDRLDDVEGISIEVLTVLPKGSSSNAPRPLEVIEGSRMAGPDIQVTREGYLVNVLGERVDAFGLVTRARGCKGSGVSKS